MKTLQAICAIFYVLLGIGCTSTEHIRRSYSSAQVCQTEDWRGYIVEPGQVVVLTKSAYTSTVPMLPDAICGFTLFIELKPEYLRSGEHVEIPSEKAIAFLHVLRAPLLKNYVDVRGTLEVIEIGEKGILGFIDLNSPTGEWRYKGHDLYKSAPIRCFGMTDSCLESNNTISAGK